MLWIFWGLTGWKLRLRPLRFFLRPAQSQSDEPFTWFSEPHECIQHLAVPGGHPYNYQPSATLLNLSDRAQTVEGGGPRVVVSTAAFHARVRGSVPGLGGLKETKLFLPHPRVKVSIVGSLRDREVACSASDRQGSNFESCVWRTVSSQSSHHPQEVLLAQFSLYVHKGGLKPDSFHFIFLQTVERTPYSVYRTPYSLKSNALSFNRLIKLN